MRAFTKNVSNTYYTSHCGILSQYLDEISKYKVLSDDEIRKLIPLAKKGDKESISKIVNANQRFVLSVAKRYANGDDVLLSDLISEGNIGLITSIKYFNSNYKNVFLTHSAYWMQKYMLAYLTYTNPHIKVSNKAKTTKITDINNRFFLKEGRYPTTDEILDILENQYGIEITNEVDVYKVTVSSIENTKDKNNENVDFFSYYAENFKQTESNITTQHESDVASENDYSKVLISNTIGVLTEKEANVIKLLYGIGQYKEYEIQEVAEKMNISNQAVRVIKDRVLKKLKKEILTKENAI